MRQELENVVRSQKTNPSGLEFLFRRGYLLVKETGNAFDAFGVTFHHCIFRGRCAEDEYRTLVRQLSFEYPREESSSNDWQRRAAVVQDCAPEIIRIRDRKSVG